MLFDVKALLLVTLVTLTSASPIATPNTNTIEARAQIPASITCGGATFTKADIQAAIKESKTQHGIYPEYFGNKTKDPKTPGKSIKVFSNIKDGSALYEQPLKNPTWTGSE